MIYLDNAATTWPKPVSVTEAINKALTQFGANPGRGGHLMSLRTSEQIYLCRETAAKFFSLNNPAGVIFTPSCTQAINMVLWGILQKGGTVLVSDMEHNAVMRPLFALSQQRGVRVKTVPVDVWSPDKTVDNFRAATTADVRLIFCTHASNVFGSLLPIEQLGHFARKKGICFAVDAAQTAGVFEINPAEQYIDFVCAAGHKGLYGPMGTGLLLCGGNFSLPAFVRGGTGSHSVDLEQPDFMPDRLESGTPNTAGICGLNAGMKFVMRRGIANLYRQENALIGHAFNRLSVCNVIELYSGFSCDIPLAPVLSFNIRGVNSEHTADFLNKQDIAVRAGLHCAPAAHKKFQTLDRGAVRVSVSAFNTIGQIDAFCNLLLVYAKRL